MNSYKFCPNCGSAWRAPDRFCRQCGLDIETLPNEYNQFRTEPLEPTADAPAVNADFGGPSQPFVSHSEIPPARPGHPSGETGTEKKRSGMIVAVILAIVFLSGGGLYWWFSHKNSPSKDPLAINSSEYDQQKVGKTTGNTGNAAGKTTPASQQGIQQASPSLDLSRAATYLPESGLKFRFFVHYPDGNTGIVDRITARVVPSKTVQVSEVETSVKQGEGFGFGFHYVERADGTYYISDQTPMEIFPVLKNYMTVGQNWKYQDDSGEIIWTVMDMGVNLDLGFVTIKDCLVVKEDNRMVNYQSLTYYAPGKGVVSVKNPGGGADYYKLIELSKIDLTQAAATVKKWCPNYEQIMDDRTQK